MLAGVFFCPEWMDNRPPARSDPDHAMTDKRPLLRAIYDAAVARAHPDFVLGRHLRPVPKGRVICLAAGKGSKWSLRD